MYQTFILVCHLQLVVTGLLVGTLAASSAIQLGGDGVGNVGELLKLLVKVLRGSRGRVLLEPILSLLDGLSNGLLVLIINLATKAIIIVDLVLEVVGVVLEFVAGFNTLTGGLVLISVLLGLLDHALDFLGGETTLVVRDRDALSLTSALVDSRHLEDTVGIKLEGDLNLGNATGCRTACSLVSDRETWNVLQQLTECW